MSSQPSQVAEINPQSIRKNPNNPRRYFNEAALDLLKTSIQETSILVPVIVYRDPERPERFVLMDGERRWSCALDLGLERIPANIIRAPNPLDNLLQMFNIHAVREQWPLISTALSLGEVMKFSGETREARLAELTGLTRSTVRRAKRIFALPFHEKQLIEREAHLDRAQQVHREDLYLEIDAAESVIRSSVPEVADHFSRYKIIRQFAKKREEGKLNAVTDFRAVGKLVKAMTDGVVTRSVGASALDRLIEDVSLNPRDVYEQVAERAVQQQSIARRAQLLMDRLRAIEGQRLSAATRRTFVALRDQLNSLLGHDA